MVARRAKKPANWDPNLKSAYLSQLTRLIRRVYDRAYRRLVTGSDGAPTAGTNRIDAMLRQLRKLEAQVTWLEVQAQNWNVYTLWIGDDPATRTPLRIWIFDKPLPAVLPREADHLARHRQLDLFSSFFTPSEVAAADTIVRLVLTHNTVDASQRRATAISLKMLSRTGTTCYQEWRLWSVGTTAAPATTRRSTVDHPGPQIQVPADPIEPAKAEIREDRSHEGSERTSSGPAPTGSDKGPATS